MPATDADDLIRVLLTRHEIMDCLCAGARTKPELSTECSVSRSTIDRGIQSLENRGLVRRGSRSRYEATPLGHLLAREYRQLRESFDEYARARDLLEWLPPDNDIDLTVFEGADVTTTRTFAPHVVEEVLSEGCRIRLAAPIGPLIFAGLVVGDFLEAVGSFEIVFDADVLTEFEAHYPFAVDSLLTHDSVDIYQSEQTLPFSLILVDCDGTTGELLLVVQHGNDSMSVVRNQSPDSVAWGEETYERYHKLAERYERPKQLTDKRDDDASAVGDGGQR